MMRTDTGKTFNLKDYKPYPFKIKSTNLTILLSPQDTVIVCELSIEHKNSSGDPKPLILDGEELELLDIELNGQALAETDYELNNQTLTIIPPSISPFIIKTKVRINPSTNTQLMGLYRSSDNYCTQCEAEGFRRITYYPDRPDVMSVFTCRIEGSKQSEPILLSNGNLIETGDLDGKRHFAIWHDPHPKPAYLFALVGGDLGMICDNFLTIEKRNIELRIYVEHGKENQALYAMDALKRSMKWDEERFGRAYDLDIFMIVAVSDFNMGAMENKGLNIFNDRLVLALPDTATDANYNAIEAVIAHEYFHNWTGNRITCRDWFQLCLKEGLTVYRDSEFTADMRSRAVKRIEDVKLLRSAQFPEDAGPLAHPVRPESYKEINNFYTATVYEKGAELVRMLHTILGPQEFQNGINLYFERHDGDATTIEAWLTCFEDATGSDLEQFALWYSQAGTPQVCIEEEFQDEKYILKIKQTLPQTPDQTSKSAMHIPLRFGLLNSSGETLQAQTDCKDISVDVIHLTEKEQKVVFENLSEKPVLSILRGFSAPVHLKFEQPDQDQFVLAAHDPDPFNRWQAVQNLAITALKNAVYKNQSATDIITTDPGIASSLRATLKNDSLDPAFRALCLSLPTPATLAQEIGREIDPDQLYQLCEAQTNALAIALFDDLPHTFENIMPISAYDPGSQSANARQLANACLNLLVRAEKQIGGQNWAQKAITQFETADNMTNRMAALNALVNHANGYLAEDALNKFEAQYYDNPLVMDLWFSLQARKEAPETLEKVIKLTNHPVFSFDTPNRVYSLIRSFAMSNLTAFNRADGKGYEFIADCVLRLNHNNPQVAARVLSAFRSWRMLETGRAKHAKAALIRIQNAGKLSTDVADIVERTLN